MGGDNRRVIREIKDITDGEALIRYAVASHIRRMDASPKLALKDKELAAALGKRGDNFSHCLNDTGGKNQKFTDIDLKVLDNIFYSIGLEGAGGLSALSFRLRSGQHEWQNLAAHIPPTWSKRLDSRSTREIEVLNLAADLITKFWAAGLVGKPAQHNAAEIPQVVERLALMGAAPPTLLNVEALVMLGTLAGYAFTEMAEQLRKSLTEMPLGFRVWRALTKSVRLNASEKGQDTDMTKRLARFVRSELQLAEKRRDASLYPGRSLDLELALTIPHAWSPPDADGPGGYVEKVLIDRARNTEATLRERGTAAHGLWQRAIDGNRLDERVEDRARQVLEELIAQCNDESVRPDIVHGKHWLAATLRHVLTERTPVCNQWPDVQEDWLRTVKRFAGELERYETIPDDLRPATRTLFEHVLLQNAGVVRRQAIDTLVVAGWGEAVTNTLADLLKTEKDESWLRIRALFALGFMQHRDHSVEEAFIDACQHADRRLSDLPDSSNPPMSLVNEMHAALFAIGDCFGVPGAEASACAVRAQIEPILRSLTSGRTHTRPLWPVARATAYLLTVTAQNREVGSTKPDLSEELLRVLLEHPDPQTQKISSWALEHRFVGDSVKPLLDAATT